MKTRFKIVVTSALTLFSMHAYAEGKFYIESKAGMSIPFNIKADRTDPEYEDFIGVKLKKSSIFAIGGGYDFNDRFTIGASLSLNPKFKYRFIDIDDYVWNTTGKVKALSATVNGYYNLFNIHNLVVPYIGGGIGFARMTLSDRTVMKNGALFKTIKGASKNNLTWNLTVGSLININARTKVVLEYKYADLGQIKSGNIDIFPSGKVLSRPIAKTKFRTHNIMIGLRYYL